MKSIGKIIVFVIIVLLIIYIYNFEEKNPRYSKSELLEMEIEELKEDNTKLEDERNSLNSELDNLRHDYEYSQELIQLLREQIESYGIEPYEL
jgi:FtsZ-binding cell division protein ZapB